MQFIKLLGRVAWGEGAGRYATGTLSPGYAAEKKLILPIDNSS